MLRPRANVPLCSPVVRRSDQEDLSIAGPSSCKQRRVSGIGGDHQQSSYTSCAMSAAEDPFRSEYRDAANVPNAFWVRHRRTRAWPPLHGVQGILIGCVSVCVRVRVCVYLCISDSQSRSPVRGREALSRLPPEMFLSTSKSRWL